MAITRTPVMVSARLGEDDAFGLDRYLADGGYQALERALGQLFPEDIHEEVRRAGLTGRSGGAAFTTATKWALLGQGQPRYLVVNGDESEPGFFKDRLLMERDPHQLIEGALLAAYATGAWSVFIYIRGEFAKALERLQEAVNEAYEQRCHRQQHLGFELLVRCGRSSRCRCLHCR